ITSGDRRSVAIHDARTGHVLRTVPAGSPPQHVAFERGRAFVTSGEDGTLRFRDLDGRLLRTTAIPVGSYNVHRGPGRILHPFPCRGNAVRPRRGRRRDAAHSLASSSHDACFTYAYA